MKKFVIIFTVLFLLVSCVAKENTSRHADIKLIRRGGFSTKAGYYYLDNKGFMRYLDYGKGEVFYACSRKNCKHQVPDRNTPIEERCPAYIGSEFIGSYYGDKIYLFLPVMEEKSKLVLISSNPDLSDKKEILKFDGDHIRDLLVKDKTAYFFTSKAIYEKDELDNEVPSGRFENYFCKFNFENEKLEVEKLDIGGYSQSVSVLGHHKDGFYLAYTWLDEKLDISELETMRDNKKYFSYDFLSGEMEDFKEAEGKDILLVYSKEDKLTMLEKAENNSYGLSSIEDGETLDKKLMEISKDAYGSANFNMDLNGYLFYQDLAGKSHKINLANLEETDFPQKIDKNYFYYVGGGYYYLVMEEGNLWSCNFIKADDFNRGNLEGLIKAN